jgi:uncharacterized cupin superfamily protein
MWAGNPKEEKRMPVEVKNFRSPDETRPFEGKGQARVVELAGHTVGEGTFEAGWKWSENVKPIAGTDSCQVAHFAYVLSGSMTIHMDDGSETEINAGDVVAIPPGHDAEVVGPEDCVMIDFGEIGDYARRS